MATVLPGAFSYPMSHLSQNLPSKHINHLTPLHHIHCYHSSLSHYHLSPGLLQWPYASAGSPWWSTPNTAAIASLSKQVTPYHSSGWCPPVVFHPFQSKSQNLHHDLYRRLYRIWLLILFSLHPSPDSPSWFPAVSEYSNHALASGLCTCWSFDLYMVCFLISLWSLLKYHLSLSPLLRHYLNKIEYPIPPTPILL